ncbi:hypothetical protein [Undibacterium sp. Ji83W]|uniref:hypothetical protein n=1 Tax=Undibacterium sp. Ji83W TaxID=3413043 RepID=UPI003BF4640D
MSMRLNTWYIFLSRSHYSSAFDVPEPENNADQQPNLYNEPYPMSYLVRSVIAIFSICCLALFTPASRAEVPPLKAAELDAMPFKFEAQVISVSSKTLASDNCKTEVRFELTASKVKDMGTQHVPEEFKLTGSAFSYHFGCVGPSGMRIFEFIKPGEHILIHANSKDTDGSFELTHYSQVTRLPLQSP